MGVKSESIYDKLRKSDKNIRERQIRDQLENLNDEQQQRLVRENRRRNIDLENWDLRNAEEVLALYFVNSKNSIDI